MTLSLEYHLPFLESFRKLAVGRINARGMAVKQPWRWGRQGEGAEGRRLRFDTLAQREEIHVDHISH